MQSQFTKTCARCGEGKPLDAFYRDSRRRDGRYPRCKDCVKAHQKTWRKGYYQANKATVDAACRAYHLANRKAELERKARYRREHLEVNREAVQRYRAKNPEKAAAVGRNYRARLARAAGTHTATDVQRKYEEQRGECYWCGAALDGVYHVDHVIPISKGGGNGPGNICCACPSCNLSKCDKMPWEFSDRLF